MTGDRAQANKAASPLENLPDGEEILWRGGPDWMAIAMHVFHVRAVAIYFTALMLWQVASAMMMGGAPFNVALADGLLLVPMGLFALGLLGLLAWLIAKTTTYTITTNRVVFQVGVALPKFINIPFARVGSAGLILRKSGNGDIPLQMTGPDRAFYLPLWPHARPWRLAHAEPMLRGLPKAEACADILAKALAAKAGQAAPAIKVEQPKPVRGNRPAEQAAAANG